MYSSLVYLLFNSFIINHFDFQNTENVAYSITYDFISITDTIENKYGNTISFTLYHFDGESRFIQSNSIFNDSMGFEFEKEHPEIANPSSQEEAQRVLDLYSEQFKVWNKKIRAGGYIVQKLHNSKKVRNILEFTFPKSYLEEDMIFDWKLQPEIDTVIGIPCQLATVKYGGREYQAWYAPSIPLPDGPYVFTGLPGLIVKISDSQGWYTFTIKSLSLSPQKRFWKQNFITNFYTKLGRKSFVEKLKNQQQNPRIPGVINTSEKNMFGIKESAKRLIYMLLEKSN